MKRLLCILLTLSFFAVNGYSQTVYSITVDATINPATAEYIENGIRKAEDARANCLLILLNTPGGLLKSTRVIVSNIIDANVPVIVFVAPPGAHAGSAGVFITMAAHIAAMAPGTNIGAAHPVELQGSPDSVMNEKSTNDAVAFIKSIAGKRNRNLQWAEDAVRNSRAITEKEALENNVIDLVAANVPDLLNKLDGRKVELPYFTE